MAEDLGDKTEPASPRRREEARTSGSVAKSMDLTAAISFGAALVGLIVLVPWTMRETAVFMRLMLDGAVGESPAGGDWARHELAFAVSVAAKAAGPFLALMFVVAWAATAWQVGWLFTLKPLQPKLSRLDLIKGAKRFVDARALMRAVMSFGKVSVIFAVSVAVIYRRYEDILTLPRYEFAQLAVKAGWMLAELMAWLVLILIILGILDFAFQRWNWEREHRMTKHEVKEEVRTTMGDPLLKQRQRGFARKILNQRLKQTVPTADVVVTNPEHISIAMKWDPKTMNAPKVIAKGADYVALRIRQIALAHGVPIIERPSLARAMYRNVHVGREVPTQFYQAIAEVLAHVYRLSGRKAG